MSKITDSTKIGKAAERFLENLLNESTGWILRSDTPDYGVDYSAEYVEGKELTGRRIYIQLKGTRRLRTGKGFVLFPMEVRHLRYYQQVEQVPVFLVVVDTVHSNGYFVFLQKYLDELESEDTKELTTKSVAIPAGNLISDMGTFRIDVEAAWDYMKERHPGTPLAAIRKKEAILHGLDDRIDCRVDIIGGKEVIHLKCKPGHEVGLKITGKADDPLLAKLVMGYGSPGSINFEDVKIDGSRIFEHFGNGKTKLRLSLSPNKAIGATLRIIENGRNSLLAEFPIESSLGASGFSCRTPESSALHIQFNADFPKENVVSELRMNLAIDLEKWIGQDISRLEGLKKLNALCGAAMKASEVKLEVWKSGNRIFGTGSVTLDQALFRDIRDILMFLKMAGEVFKQSGRYKQLPELRKIHPEDWYVAELLYAINVRKEVFISSFSGRKLAFKVEGINPAVVPEKGKRHVFKMDMIRLPVSLLGEDLMTSMATLFVTNAYSELTMETKGKATLTINGSKNSELKLVP